MKKLLVIIGAMFICTFAIAHTINWYVDNTLYQTTTCNSGDNIIPPTAPDKYGYTFDGWVMPYTRLEYIESTGTQYIDTGIVVPTSYKWELKLNTGGSNTAPYWGFANNIPYTSATSFYSLGAKGDDSGNTYITIGAFSGTTEQTQDHFYSATGITAASLMGGNAIHTIKCNGDFSFTADNTPMVQSAAKTFDAFVPAGTAYLFARHVPGTPIITRNGARIYSYQVWNANGTLVQNLIPAKRRSDNAIGMYDTVTNTFFENAGTGTFIAGPEVSGL